jgi:hypothetical protein
MARRLLNVCIMKTKTKVRPGRIAFNHNTSVRQPRSAIMKNTKTKIIRIAANHNVVVR